MTNGIGDDQPLPPLQESAMISPPRLDRAKQRRHGVGSSNYIPGRNILTDPDPQALLKQNAGTALRIGDLPVGQPGSKERVDFGKAIGQYVDPETEGTMPTTRGIIVYGHRGSAHMIPARPRGLGP
jgi:filamentous hemagglutinin